MYPDIVNVKAPEDSCSSAGPTESKSDPIVIEGSLVNTTDVKQELSSERQDEPPLPQNKIVLSTRPASTEVNQPHPVRHVGLRDALSHFEQAALSRESVEDLPIRSQSNDISPFGKEVSSVCAEQSTEISAQRENTDSGLFGPVFHPSPNYRPLTPSRLEPWAHPIVFRREPPPPAPEQPSLAPSNAEREKEPVPDEPLPSRTPTPPYQYASVQRTRMIRLMIEKFGPDWVPVEEEEQSDDERDGAHEDSYEESEDDGMHLLPGDRNNVRAFFDTYWQLREAARVERGEPPRSSPYDSDVEGQENIISREELIELGVPTVRLVTTKPEPDVPLPFH